MNSRTISLDDTLMEKKKKNPHAVALGRRGGRARAEKLSAEEKSDIARKAINTRWDGVRQAKGTVKPKSRKGKAA